ILSPSAYSHPLLSLFLYSPGDHRDLHSFPTRRSSDLVQPRISVSIRCRRRGARYSARTWLVIGWFVQPSSTRGTSIGQARANTRSEEHTSELQSRVDLVCRLLLEKKKMNGELRSPAEI